MTEPTKPEITYQDFDKVDMRVGRVLRAQVHPTARKPALQVWIDFGPEIGEKKTSAKLTQLYTPEDLVGRLVIAVVNFPRLQVGDFMSEVLILGAVPDQDTVILLQPDRDTPLGMRIA